MDDRLEPLPELARQLLEAERTVPEPPSEVRDRMAARMSPLFVGTAVAAGLVATDAAGLAADGALTSASGGVAKGTVALLQSKLAVAALAFSIGAGAGATVHAVATAPETPTAAVTASAVRELPPRSAAPVPPLLVEPRASALVSASASSAPSASSFAVAPAASGPLKRERSLIDTARMAILRGDKAAALRALESHAREFPNGQHASEREALQRRARALEPSDAP